MSYRANKNGSRHTPRVGGDVGREHGEEDSDETADDRQSAGQDESDIAEETEKSLSSLRQLLSGELHTKFASELESELDSGLPLPIALAKKFAERIASDPLGEKEDSEIEHDGEKKAAAKPQDQSIFNASVASLAKRRKSLKLDIRRKAENKPLGEELSKELQDVRILELDKIKNDPTFQNTRLFEEIHNPDWSSNEGQSMHALQSSMAEEGLKVPVVVIPAPNGCFFTRAGFRRIKCARNLKWAKIPAIVLPADTPVEKEYWTNILENATRKNLTSYEASRSAQLMRDKFGVSPAQYAERTGYSEGHVKKLLSCIDRLPDVLVDEWKSGSILTLAEWYKLSLLEHENAIKYFNRWTGKRPRDRLKELEARRQEKQNRKLAPAWYLDRLQKLYIGIEGSEVEPKVRQLLLYVVEFAMGQSNKVPGVYDSSKHNAHAQRANLRATLAMPKMDCEDDLIDREMEDALEKP